MDFSSKLRITIKSLNRTGVEEMAGTAFTYKKHKLSTDDRTWLAHAAQFRDVDPKVMKVDLWGKIPPGYDPRQLDGRLWLGSRVSAIGLSLVDPDNVLLRDMGPVILGIRELILKVRGIEEITSAQVAALTSLPIGRVEQAMRQIAALGAFSNGGSGTSDGGMSLIRLQGHEAYDEYLQFQTLDKLLERIYVSKRPQDSRSQNALSQYAEGFSDGPKNYAAEPTVNRNSAFIIMAIDPAKPELEDISVAIRNACSKFGVIAERADQIEHQGRITDLVLERIRTSELLIADLTFERPNVYYEVGFAHALGKRPILYRKAGTKIHFDLSVHNVPEYRNATDLENALIGRLEAVLGRSPKETKAKRR